MDRSSNHRAVLRAAGVLAAASVLAALAAPGCIIDWADDCTHSLGYPGCKGGPSSSSGGAGAGGSTTTGMTGGSDGGAVCTDASVCPPVPPGPCFALGTSACVLGKCTVTFAMGLAPSQKYGSCKKNWCAADGGFSTTEDDSNFFDDGNPCTTDACVGGKPLNTTTMGASCLLPSMIQGVCEPNPDPSNAALSVCAACDPTSSMSCSAPGFTCIQGSCLLPHCGDGAKDGNETDTDCGGPDCLPCGTNATCLSSADCFSGRCIMGKCPAPSCTDGIQNGSETDTDCGGPLCPPCAATLKCTKPLDCLSGVCKPPSLDAGPMGSIPDRCQAPSCTDGVQNGNETGIDCGDNGGDAGPPCPPCQ